MPAARPHPHAPPHDDGLGVEADPLRPPQEGATQLVLGGRLNTGPVTPGSSFDLVPEVAFGVGEKSTTVLVAGNLQYSLGEIAGTGVVPFVSGGGGVFSETVLALNAGYGAALDLRPGGRTMRAFVEHQGINPFTRNRLLAGARLQF